jgi:hypothetical protein
VTVWSDINYLLISLFKCVHIILKLIAVCPCDIDAAFVPRFLWHASTGHILHAARTAAAQQAYWFKRSDFKKKNMEFTEYFLEIGTEADLCNWLDTISSPPPIPAIMS